MARLLGEILVRAKVISPRQLDEAISNQVVFGGRLGTSLMDLGYITEEVLGQYLSTQSGVQTIEPTAYTKIHKSIAKALPKAVAERTLSVPLVQKDKVLHVVMADPNNIAHQDELRFASGCKLQIYVAPEVRVWYLLNKLYGTKRDVRYVTLSRTDQMVLNAGTSRAKAAPKAQKVLSASGVQDASQTGDLMSEAEFAQMTQTVGMAGPPVFAPDGHLAAGHEDDVLLGDVADDNTEVLILDDEVKDETIIEPPVIKAPLVTSSVPAAPQPVVSQAVQAAPVPAPAPAPAGPPVVDDIPLRKITLAQATKALQNVEHRDQIARIVLGFASGTFKRTALFMVRPDMVMGWDATGKGLSREVIERLMIPLNSPSVFKLVFDMQAHFLGAIQKNPVNNRFLKTLGGEQPRSAFVIPILFKGKVVNILYGDNGPGTDATFDIGELLILAMKIPQTFEDLLRRMKNPPPAGS